MKQTVLVTGANGFVGSAQCLEMARRGHTVRAAVRSASATARLASHDCQIVHVGGNANWDSAVSGVDVVIHLAARVHVMRDSVSDPLAAYREVNVAATERLARVAAARGVQRFVFVSSIKVNGEGTQPGRPYSPDDAPAPVDPYGVSKMEAEQALRQVAQETGLEVAIVRPVLVYGPGVRANFESMMRWIDRGVPLPFGSIDNRRSLVALDNLVSLLATCASHPAASGQTFLVNDGEDLSMTELLRRTALAMGRTARLLPVPVTLMSTVARLAGRKDLAERLFGSLQVDSSKARQLLGWTPPITVDEALGKTAAHFLARR